jgi:hypothetical protein
MTFKKFSTHFVPIQAKTSHVRSGVLTAALLKMQVFQSVFFLESGKLSFAPTSNQHLKSPHTATDKVSQLTANRPIVSHTQ